MNVQSVYQSGGLRNAAGPPPGGHDVAAALRASGTVGSIDGHEREDLVDLVGLESVGEAFRMLSSREPLPIPEPVGRAIRAMVKEVLEGLPGG